MICIKNEVNSSAHKMTPTPTVKARCSDGLRQGHAQQHEIGAAVAELSKHQLGLAVLSAGPDEKWQKSRAVQRDSHGHGAAVVFSLGSHHRFRPPAPDPTIPVPGVVRHPRHAHQLGGFVEMRRLAVQLSPQRVLPWSCRWDATNEFDDIWWWWIFPKAPWSMEWCGWLDPCFCSWSPHQNVHLKWTGSQP